MRKDHRLEHMRRMMTGTHHTQHVETKETMVRERVEVPRAVYDRLADLAQRLGVLEEKAAAPRPAAINGQWVDDLAVKLGEVESAVASAGGEARSAGASAKRAEAALQLREQDIRSAHDRIDMAMQIIGEIRDRVGRLPGDGGGDDFDLPRMFGGSGGAPSSAVASLEDRMDDLNRQVNAISERADRASQNTSSAARELGEGLAREVDLLKRRFAEAERLIAKHDDELTPKPTMPPKPPSIDDERNSAMLAIRDAAVRRRNPDLSTAIDGRDVAHRLAEIAFNALSGRIDAIASMETLGAALGSDWQNVAKELVARHDWINALTAETVALERQATGAINSQELATIDDVRAECVRWLSRIKSASGGAIHGREMDGGGS
jgi:chromosome segregation ATPase